MYINGQSVLRLECARWQIEVPATIQPVCGSLARQLPSSVWCQLQRCVLCQAVTKRGTAAVLKSRQQARQWRAPTCLV